MWKLSNHLTHGRFGLTVLMPGIPHILKVGPLLNTIKAFNIGRYAINALAERKTPSDITGEFAAGALLYPIFKTPRKINLITFGLIVNRRRPLLYNTGATQRFLIGQEDRGLDDRIVKEFRVVYHEANKIGKHLDIHIGHMSLTIRVDGKPVEKEIHFDKDGWLTESSRKALINHLRNEISNNSRMVHNHDHTVNNAKCQWSYNPNNSNISGYGMGPTRQTILIDKAELYHSDLKSSQHWYIPSIEKHQGLYIYQIYPGETLATRTSIDNGKAPILIWGKLIPRDKKFEDRLHLKMMLNLKEFKSKVDLRTVTKKEDGASTYFMGNELGFKFFSPRISKETGHRIEYTYKLPELSNLSYTHNPVGMGELLFWKPTKLGKIAIYLGINSIPKLTRNYLSPAEIGGVLNSDRVRPRNIFPDLKVYRMDEWDRNIVINLPFWQNRILIEQMCNDLNSPFITPTKFMDPYEHMDHEGYVAVPEGKTINEGLKFKFKENEFDWKIDSVDFYLSEKGNIAGVINCTSLESGKQFKLGPGSIGTFDECMDMLENPDQYVGQVMKVAGFNGHEARGAKLVMYHLDK